MLHLFSNYYVIFPIEILLSRFSSFLRSDFSSALHEEFSLDFSTVFVWEISYTRNNTTRHFWNLARKKTLSQKTIWSENDLAYMIFLAYRYVCYTKPQYYLSLHSYYYDIICGNQKNKNWRTLRIRKLNFRLRDVLGFLFWRLTVEIPQLQNIPTSRFQVHVIYTLTSTPDTHIHLHTGIS